MNIHLRAEFALILRRARLTGHSLLVLGVSIEENAEYQILLLD